MTPRSIVYMIISMTIYAMRFFNIKAKIPFDSLQSKNTPD